MTTNNGEPPVTLVDQSTPIDGVSQQIESGVEVIKTTLPQHVVDKLTDIDDAPSDPEEWRKLYQEFVDNPPNEGDMLLSSDGSPVKLTIELISGKEPFIFGRAFVPGKVGAKLGWFAQGMNDKTDYGWKIILLPKSRDQVIKRLGILTGTAQVNSLLILRRSKSGRSLLGEVNNW